MHNNLFHTKPALQAGGQTFIPSHIVPSTKRKIDLIHFSFGKKLVMLSMVSNRDQIIINIIRKINTPVVEIISDT
jgi:hypothetical protein